MDSIVVFMGHQDHHVVAGLHRQLEVVRDQQDPTVEIAADPLDQLMEHVRSGDIDALARFVQDQQIGPVDQRPGQQQALELSARQCRDRRTAEAFQTDGRERGVDFTICETPGQLHQATHRQGQRGAYRQSLRDIAHLQGGRPLDRPFVDADQSEDSPRAGGLARTVRPNQEHQLAASDLKVDMPDDPTPCAAHSEVERADQRGGSGGLRYFQGVLVRV